MLHPLVFKNSIECHPFLHVAAEIGEIVNVMETEGLVLVHTEAVSHLLATYERNDLITEIVFNIHSFPQGQSTTAPVDADALWTEVPW